MVAAQNGARKVTLQHMGILVDEAAGKTSDPPLLQPNQIQLYSYYKPGLLAGNYAIEAEQNIASEGPYGTENLRICNRKKADPDPSNIEPQIFTVVAPQFSLDPSLIDSYYPPDGHQDEGRILPHLVLNDPHFPWERHADPKSLPLLFDEDVNQDGNFLNAKGAVVDKKDASKRNAVPWVALMMFDPDELPLLTVTEAKTLQLPNNTDLERQPSNGAFLMTVQDYLKIPPTSRVNFEAGMQQNPSKPTPKELKEMTDFKASQEKMTTIFPTKSKFLELFPNIPSLRYTSHVRNINTTGFPGAGIDELGLYSIIVSNRVGNYTTDKPITQICHLVSVEHFETTKKSIQPGADRIGLISLFSWTYTALPPDPVNFIDSITRVVNEMQMLRPKEQVLTALKTQIEASKDIVTSSGLNTLQKRLLSGYTLARWRSETGEETVAFNRGPLVPQKVPKPPDDWPTSSNTSKEFQILDTVSGIMDLSYSSAWQLGKTLAISDTTFSGALSRLRSTIQRQSQSKTRSELNNVPPKEALINAISSDIIEVKTMSSGQVSDPRRVSTLVGRELAPAPDDPSVIATLDKNIANAILSAGSAGNAIYNGFNEDGHNNTDWTIIHTWISEKLYLSEIPGHLLIPDPTFLPEESLRFFHIDDIWLDCMIDGALSVGNHLERDDDRIRQGIKQTYNAYLEDKTLPIRPQVPGYGFILRSQIVKVMPDLKITITWQVPDTRYPFCRYIRPDDHTILCLLDRPPEELATIELSQPSHQQRFSFGHTYNPTSKNFEFALRHLFTDDEKDMTLWGPIGTQPNAEGLSRWFAHSELEATPRRVLNLARMAPDVNQLIRNTTPEGHVYSDFVANSAELALELNDPSYYFLITPPNGGTATNTSRNRQLYCETTIPPTESTIGISNPDPKDSKQIGTAIPPQIPGTSVPIHPIATESPSQTNHVVVIHTSPVPANPTTPLKTALPLQCFNVQIYADYKGPPIIHPDSNAADPAYYVPTQNEYLYDLIFSVRKLPTRAKADYDLREIIINIPTTTIRTPAEPLIDAGSEGPRARMLSNQRFVPFLNWTDEYLQVRLVPRSAKEHPVMKINDNRSREISFRLQEVNIPPTRTKVWTPIHGQNREQLGVAKVMIYERYETPGGVVSAVAAPQNVFVIKRDIKDDVPYST